MFKKIEFTHNDLRITDIRLTSNGFYIIMFDHPHFSHETFFIPDVKFNRVLKQYFLNDNYTRKDILDVKYNVNVTKGGFIRDGVRVPADPNKWYLNTISMVGNLSAGYQKVAEDLNELRYDLSNLDKVYL